MKKIIAVFDIPGMTVQQYDNVIRDLSSSNAKKQPARPHHFAAPQNGGWLVVDVWNSPEELNAFAGTLIPLLVKNGVTPVEPKVFPLHHEMD